MILDREARSYILQLAEMDHIFTNSQNVHDRLLAYCGYESEIVYPPTDTTFFTPGESAIAVDIPFAA